MITMESWPEDWSKVEPWTEIDLAVYNHFINVLPPIECHGFYFQCPEPHDHQLDCGRWKGRYLTFTKIGKRFWYLGIQFAGIFPERISNYGKEVN